MVELRTLITSLPESTQHPLVAEVVIESGSFLIIIFRRGRTLTWVIYKISSSLRPDYDKMCEDEKGFSSCLGHVVIWPRWQKWGWGKGGRPTKIWQNWGQNPSLPHRKVKSQARKVVLIWPILWIHY